MMGCNDDGCEFNSSITADSFNGIKLRPLIPKQPPPFNHHCIKPTDFFALNHNLAGAATGDQNKREQNMNSQQPPVVVSSRWNPTPEQLQSLEELYRRGTRTPSADQIQNITAQLRRYGRVEGKNVFYWFQNHKARERQKRRRQMEPNPDHKPSPFNENFARKDSGRTEDQIEQVKNWTTTTNSTNLAEESVSVAMATKAVMAEGIADNRCVQFNEGELQNRRNFMRRNATWQMMQMSPNQYPLILNSTPFSSTVFNKITPMDFIKNDEDLYKKTHEEEEEEDGCKGESQTLQLFPLRSSEEDEEEEEDGDETETLMSVTEAMKASNFITPTFQFYEFLPLKN